MQATPLTPAKAQRAIGVRRATALRSASSTAAVSAATTSSWKKPERAYSAYVSPLVSTT